MNIANHIERGNRLFPDKPAVIFEGKTLTYGELDSRVNQAANAFCSLGVREGDRIAILLPNIPEFLFAYFGALKIGAIAVAINTMLKQDELDFILNDCGANLLITQPAFQAHLPQISPSGAVDSEWVGCLKTILFVDSRAHHQPSFGTLLASASDKASAVDLNQQTPATIIYTSGTTGFPKGAVLSHGNIIANSSAQQQCCQIGESDRLLLYLPLFHCFGQNAILNSSLHSGAALVMERVFQPDQILKRVAQERITMFFGVPTVFILLLKRDLSPYDLSSLRFYFAAGAPLPAEIAQQWFEKFGVPIHEGYGLTEASPCVSYNHELQHRVGSIGSPVPQVEMQVMTSDSLPANPGELGEIIVRGPNVMLGYWNRKEATAKVICNGWLHTGDVGYQDDAGYFYIVDRIKDMINLSGLKVYPAEVENVLYQHPAVVEAAVYGVPDQLQGEKVKATICLRPETDDITPEMIIAFCSEKIATYKVPRQIDFAKALPKNATGKILKRQLREFSSVPLPSKIVQLAKL